MRILGLLLLLVLVALVFTMAQTIQAVGSFQQRTRAVRAGDVNTIRPWMTVHAVSHIYHIPEGYLFQELHISNPTVMRHVTLNGIALDKKQPLKNVISTVQSAIVLYRKTHHQAAGSPLLPSSDVFGKTHSMLACLSAQGPERSIVGRGKG